ncbi:unnamed protein product, partial [Mesorhabditis belari]|uniref:B box-type domain-containing protein n=1 Tax=Mesorhabditis belari TaxID=2138241 RepID=A0AAF3EN05_9BILA
MDLQLKVFKSLSCSKCGAPFSKSADGTNGPRKYPTCGVTVCKQCAEKAITPGEHVGCSAGHFSNCFLDQRPAYFLIELLNSPALAETSYGSGYYLTKPIEIPKCMICHKEYSIETEDREPTNSFVEFLKELPEMIKQVENTEETITKISPTIEVIDHFDCSECEREFPIEDMFSCSDCSKKICGSCVTRRHRSHKLTDLFVEETCRISGEMKQMVSIQINGYKKIFPELHQELIEKIASFEKALSGKAEKIEKLENFEKTKNEIDKCKDYGDRFERISEDYLPNLRLFNTNLQNLIDELNEAKISETEMKRNDILFDDCFVF